VTDDDGDKNYVPAIK